jgi:WD40 repeat protein
MKTLRSTVSPVFAFPLILLALSVATLTAQSSKATTSDPAASGVTPTGNLAVRRFSQTATLLPNGKVLIAGGMERNGKWDSSAELYDPRTGKFVATASMASPRACHTSTLLPDGKVLIAGGSSGMDLMLSSSELYDPATSTFKPSGNLTGPRCGGAAVLLKSGKVLLVGGEGAHEDERLATAELYDPSTGRFSATGSMHVPRNSHRAVLLQDGRVLVIGGDSAGNYPNARIEASAEIYDPATGRFTPTGSMKIARHKFAAVVLADGEVLVAGGSDNRDWRGKYASAEIFSAATGKFSPVGDMSSPRFKLTNAAVRLPDGRVLIAGGAEQPEIYDPAVKTFRPVSGGVGNGRYFSSATLLADGRVLIAGGYGDDPMAGAVANAWLYRP